MKNKTYSYFQDLYKSTDSYRTHHYWQEHEDILKSILVKYIKQRKNILDIGMGCNPFALRLGFEKVYATDISTMYSAWHKKSKVNAEYVDIQKGLPFAGIKFDCILCMQVLEHLLDGRKLLKDIHERLDEDGVLLITVPNEMGFYWNRLRNFVSADVYYNDSEMYEQQHLRFFNEKNMKKMLHNSGFIVLELTGYNQSVRTSVEGICKSPPFKQKLATWWTSMFATDFIVIARRVK